MYNSKNTEPNALICTNAHLSELLLRLSATQKAFVVAKSHHNTDVDACTEIGVSISTMRHWPASIRDLIRRAEVLIAKDVVNAALELRRQAVVRAMMVKIEGLESADEIIRQRCATEVIEWELGKAGVRVADEGDDKYRDLMERIAVATERAARMHHEEIDGEFKEISDAGDISEISNGEPMSDPEQQVEPKLAEVDVERAKREVIPELRLQRWDRSISRNM